MSAPWLVAILILIATSFQVKKGLQKGWNSLKRKRINFEKSTQVLLQELPHNLQAFRQSRRRRSPRTLLDLYPYLDDFIPHTTSKSHRNRNEK